MINTLERYTEVIRQLAYSDIAFAPNLNNNVDWTKKQGCLFYISRSIDPIVIFDLKKTRFVKSVELKNRSINKERAKNLQVKVSINGSEWINENVNFCLDLDIGKVLIEKNIRFLMLSLVGEEIFHLNEVYVKYIDNIFELSDMSLENSGAFVKDQVYYPVSNQGFFSVCSWALKHFAITYPLIKEICGKHAFYDFKDKADYDPWSDYFLPPDLKDTDININYFNKGVYHRSNQGTYSNLVFKESSALIAKYFRPSTKVQLKIEKFTTKYKFNLNKTIVIYVRGGDKYLEVIPKSVELYASKAVEIINKNKDFKVLIQTDQLQVRDHLLKTFGNRAFFIDELPVTETNLGIHKINKDNKLEFAINFLAIVYILSKCNSLILSYGSNVSYWIVLFRGNLNNVEEV